MKGRRRKSNCGKRTVIILSNRVSSPFVDVIQAFANEIYSSSTFFLYQILCCVYVSSKLIKVRNKYKILHKSMIPPLCENTLQVNLAAQLHLARTTEFPSPNTKQQPTTFIEFFPVNRDCRGKYKTITKIHLHTWMYACTHTHNEEFAIL